MFAIAATIAAIAASAPVHAVALDAPLLAYATGRSARDCDRVFVWNRSTRRTVRLARTTSCERTSTGTGIGSVSIAGNRVLWLHFTGGNIREWSIFTATTTAPRPRRLGFVTRDVDSAAPIVLGASDTTRFGGLLPYAVDRELFVLRANGARAFSWSADARVTAVGAGRGAVAVALADGRIVVLDGGGRVEDGWAGSRAATAVFVTGNAVAAQRGRVVEVRTGSATTRWTIPTGARLRDAEGSRAVYLAGRRAILLDLASGRTRDLGPANDVQVEGSTAVVASGRAIRLVRGA